MSKKRTKRVFSSRAEVCHVWASRSQSDGRAMNIYFEGDTIYSYGSHFKMAKFQKMPNGKTVVLFNPDNYSSSTSKHQGGVLSALSGLDVQVVSIPQTFWDSYIDGKAYLIRQIEQQFILSSKAFANATLYCNRAFAYIEELQVWGTLHKHKAVYKVSDEQLTVIKRAEEQTAKCKDRQIAKDKKAELKKQAELKELKAICNGDISQYWRLNGKLPTGFSVWQHLPEKTLCRISNDGMQIETSRGARVPIKEARILYKLIKAGKPVHGHIIGSYTVVGMNGTLKIGCHEIERDEIDLLAKSAGW